jgi:hypothetical protein
MSQCSLKAASLEDNVRAGKETKKRGTEMASSHGNLSHLLPPTYKWLISSWLEEDCPSFDYAGFVVGETEGEARLLGKSQVC